ncbi:MAG: nitrate/nitrite transporter NrtS [Bacteroidota bacterium]
MRSFLKYAFQKVTIIRSVKVALIVGTILAFINHYDAIFTGTLTTTNIFQILLTYLVPYLVATYGSASHARYIELGGSNNS